MAEATQGLLSLRLDTFAAAEAHGWNPAEAEAVEEEPAARPAAALEDQPASAAAPSEWMRTVAAAFLAAASHIQDYVFFTIPPTYAAPYACSK